MTSRQACLERLLALEVAPSQAIRELAAFAWDSEPVVRIHGHHIVSVLRGYLAGAYGAELVQEWAEAIESREDVEPESEHAPVLLRVIFELANPVLEGALDETRARQLMSDL